MNVDNAINAIKPGPDDIVVFIIPAWLQQRKRQLYLSLFDLRDKSYQTYGGAYTLNMEDIYRRVREKGARFNLVISDCCNSDPSQTTVMSPEGATTRTSSVGWSKGKLPRPVHESQAEFCAGDGAAKGELSAGTCQVSNLLICGIAGEIYRRILFQRYLGCSAFLCPEADGR